MARYQSDHRTTLFDLDPKDSNEIHTVPPNGPSQEYLCFCAGQGKLRVITIRRRAPEALRECALPGMSNAMR